MIDGGLRPMLRRFMPRAQWTSVETGAIARGVPDTEFCFTGGVQGWVECKATAGWAVTLRPEQVAWIDRRSRLGGRVWIAVRRRHDAGPRRAAVDELWLVRGAFACELSTHGLEWFEVGIDAMTSVQVQHGGPSRWNWAIVEETLRS